MKQTRDRIIGMIMAIAAGTAVFTAFTGCSVSAGQGEGKNTDISDSSIVSESETAETTEAKYDCNAPLTKCAQMISDANAGDMEYVLIGEDVFAFKGDGNTIIQDADGSRFFYENDELIVADLQNEQLFFEDGTLVLKRELDTDGNETASYTSDLDDEEDAVMSRVDDLLEALDEALETELSEEG